MWCVPIAPSSSEREHFMGKKRPARRHDEDHGNESSEPIERVDDHLGKVIQQFRVSLAGVLIVSGAIAFLGLGMILYSLTGLHYWLMFLIGGTLLLLFSVATLGINIFNVGRRLEL